MNNNKNIALKGSAWTSLSIAVTMISSFVRVMILTRFLEKSDFGVVSIINMFIGLCTTFTDLGFASVIMYRKKLTVIEFSSLYWTQFILYSFIFILLWVVSPLIADFYTEYSLKVLIPIASVSILFNAFGKLYDSVLQKQYKFKLLAIRNILSNVISLILAIVLAWEGYGIYSLIVSTLFYTALINIWNFCSGKKFQTVKLIIKFKEIIPLIKIGVYQTGTQILDYISGKLDVLIIGKLLGTEVLGVYDLAKELVYKIVYFIRTVVSKVALPIIANNNTDDESVKRKFLMVTRAVSFVCLPICTIFAIFSKPIVYFVYGEKFLDASPLVTVFSLLTAITSVIGFFDMLGIAKGRTDLNFLNTVFRVVVATPLIFFAAYFNIMAVAWSQFLATIILASLFWHLVVMKTYPMSFKLYFSQFSKLLLALLLSGLTVKLIMWIYPIINENIIWLPCCYFVLFCIILALCCMTFLREECEYFYGMFKTIKRKR